MRKKLNKFVNSVNNFDNLPRSEQVLLIAYYHIEIEKKFSVITTANVRDLFELANIPTPTNFGGEIKSLLRSKKLIRTRAGYSLSRKAKVWSRERIDKGKRKITKTLRWAYVNDKRLKELETINNSDFDLSKLIQLCKELSLAFDTESFLSVAMLVRAILDHVPPIFSFDSFARVSNNYGPKSFKESMLNLENSSRKIADSFLHTPIRRREALPTSNQVDFSNDLDVLLGEIYRILK